jgi:hypothetical protein
MVKPLFPGNIHLNQSTQWADVQRKIDLLKKQNRKWICTKLRMIFPKSCQPFPRHANRKQLIESRHGIGKRPRAWSYNQDARPKRRRKPQKKNMGFTLWSCNVAMENQK